MKKKINRRHFLAAAGATTVGARIGAPLLTKTPARRVLTLVYDKSLGMMRAVDKLVP